jgi:hypothetical protein
MSKKSRNEQIADFVDRWTPELAGRYEVRLLNGEQIVIQDCHLSRDQADRPDRVWVNHDSLGHIRTDFDLEEVVSITDLEQQFEVISPANSNIRGG